MDVEAELSARKTTGNVWGYGEVTVERLFTFQVRVLKHRKENGEEVSFVSFPRRKVQGRWEDAVHPSQELRGRIAEVGESGNPKRNHKRLGTSRNRSSEYEPVSGAAQKDSKHRRDCNGRGVWSDN